MAKGLKRASSAAQLGAPAAKQRKTTVAQLVRGKLRECMAFRNLSPTEKRLIVDPQTGLTLEKRLIRDVEAADMKGEQMRFGKEENARLAQVYRRSDSVFAQLKPPAGSQEEPDTDLRKALQATYFILYGGIFC